ncbi:MAG: RNA 3'-terminal phosphate cyclase [Planctomycetota bacterium]
MTTTSPIEIDGRTGEGGGQVLRTSLSLAAALGVPLRVTDVRGGRKKPGLLRQHRTCARAVAAVTAGQLEGDELGSSELTFTPGGPPVAGDYEFAIGSAGSTMLVLQTVLPPLLLADAPSRIVVRGGTHNPSAPPFESIAHSFLPVLRRAGAEVEIELVSPGFAPAGGGEVRLHVRPAAAPTPVSIERALDKPRRRVVLRLHGIPDTVAEREWIAFAKRTDWPRSCLDVVRTEGAGGGNAMVALLEGEEATAALVSFGSPVLSSERVGGVLARSVQRFLKAGAPVDPHLADQLMVPLALLAGGRFVTGPLSRHATTNAEVIERFLPGAVSLGDAGAGRSVGVTVQGLRTHL